MQVLCPNCRTRFPDTVVRYDELLASSYSRTSYRYGRLYRSFSSVSQHGSATLCAQCAAAFNRMIGLRTLGATVGNRGFIALIVTAILFVFVYGFVPAIHKGIGLYIALIPIAVAVVALITGGVLALTSRALRPSATRFLREQSGKP